MDGGVMKWLSLKKLQFEAYTAVGMLEPAEKGTICILTYFKQITLLMY